MSITQRVGASEVPKREGSLQPSLERLSEGLRSLVGQPGVLETEGQQEVCVDTPGEGPPWAAVTRCHNQRRPQMQAGQTKR